MKEDHGELVEGREAQDDHLLVENPEASELRPTEKADERGTSRERTRSAGIVPEEHCA